MTEAERVVARLDSYSQDLHQEALNAARVRREEREQARRERARIAALRIRGRE